MHNESYNYIIKHSCPWYLLSPVSMVNRLQAGQPGFDSRQVQDIFLLGTASGPTMVPTQPPIQMAPGVLSPGVRRTGREADHTSIRCRDQERVNYT
jgi:hypothetical protein